MRLNRNDGPMRVQPAGTHTCLVSWQGHNWSATDSELKVLAQQIVRVLADKGLSFQPNIPK